ncbi:MAG: YceI family protein [Flavobacteriaceae bacterium]|nr:YceI family protein [Flavobacteriaceae bacterium]
MKKFILTILCVVSVSFTLSAQQKYSTKTGVINFEASVPSFEEVKAKNENVSAILKDDGTFASLALMKGFRFKVALMEEHFNENYAESSKYPKTTFRGKIKDFDVSQLSEVEKTFTVSGTVNMHGTDKEIEVPVSIKKDGEALVLTTNFILKPSDFNIEIPKVVSSKIAEEINVSASYRLN